MKCHHTGHLVPRRQPNLVPASPDQLSSTFVMRLSSNVNLLISDVRIPHVDRETEFKLFTVMCKEGRVWKIIDAVKADTPSIGIWQEVDGRGGLLIPS